MRPAIPFISSLDPVSGEAWKQALGAALPDFDIRDPTDFSQDEALTVRVAVIANPAPDQLSCFPNLEWVQSVWAGVDRLVGSLPPRLGIVRLVDPQLAESMAEGVLGHVLYLHRRIPEYRAQQRGGVWRQLEQPRAASRTIAILGLGNLGQTTAQRLRTSGFRVVGWSRSTKQIDGVETWAGEEALPAVLSQSDIVVILVPLTPATRHLVNARTLGACRPGTALINVARGPVIETSALLEALDSGRVGHAVLDVFDEEPLPVDDPLWSHPSVTVLPHVAAPTDRESASGIVARNIRAYFADGIVPHKVNQTDGY